MNPQALLKPYSSDARLYNRMFESRNNSSSLLQVDCCRAAYFRPSSFVTCDDDFKVQGLGCRGSGFRGFAKLNGLSLMRSPCAFGPTLRFSDFREGIWHCCLRFRALRLQESRAFWGFGVQVGGQRLRFREPWCYDCLSAPLLTEDSNTESTENP